jgi:hypothetical protein
MKKHFALVLSLTLCSATLFAGETKSLEELRSEEARLIRRMLVTCGTGKLAIGAAAVLDTIPVGSLVSSLAARSFTPDYRYSRFGDEFSSPVAQGLGDFAGYSAQFGADALGGLGNALFTMFSRESFQKKVMGVTYGSTAAIADSANSRCAQASADLDAVQYQIRYFNFDRVQATRTASSVNQSREKVTVPTTTATTIPMSQYPGVYPVGQLSSQAK